ncbi:MAG: light-harvesting protein [Pseudomonadota bacterium]
MNNSRIWLVVPPTVGLPVFLGAVAVGSFSVHVAVLSNTTWVADFLSGQELGSSATASIDGKVKTAAVTDPAAKVSMSSYDGERITVILPDGRHAEAVIDDPGIDLALEDRLREMAGK